MLAVCALAQDGATVLAPGNPPLTREMAEHRIHVQEAFLDVHLTAGQKEQLERALVETWRKNDREEIQHALEDLKFYGKDEQLRGLRAANLESYVQNLRNHKDEPEDATLLAAFEAAHPENRDTMHARGLDALVGDWQTGDALPPMINPVTHQPQGISFSEALILKIFSDGRFQHGWVHRHCAGGVQCCQETGTTAEGTIGVEGARLTLKEEHGSITNRNPCVPSAALNKSMDPQQQSFDWSLKQDAKGAPMLCLSARPFQVTEKSSPVCYKRMH